MNRKYFISTLIFLAGAATSDAQEPDQAIRTGNEFFRKGEYTRAEEAYKKAPADARAGFNRANSLYKQEKITEAAAGYDQISAKENKPDLRAASYYNKGVILSGQKKTEESIDAYKNTLRLNPDDNQARENLQKALLELRMKAPPKKENKKKTAQKPPPQPKLNPRQTEQQMKKLQQKEKEVREKQQQKKTGNAFPKDW